MSRKTDGAAPQSAADVFKAAIMKRRGAPADGARWAQFALSLKLAELEENWSEIVGPALGSRSRPAFCDASDGILTITINVSDQTVLSSVRFRKGPLEKKLSAILAPGTKCRFCVGQVGFDSKAKPPLPAWRRRAPVLLPDDAVKAEKEAFLEGGLSEELAEKLARIKLSAERIDRRGTSS